MRKIATLFLLVITLITVKATNKDNENTKALLWKISGNGLEEPSYLFGTIHMIPEELFFFPEGTEEALNSVSTLVMEIDIDIPLKEQVVLAQRMILPNSTTFSDYLTESDYTVFKNYLMDSLDMKEAKIERYLHLRPIHLTGPLLLEKYKKLETYEVHYNKLAKKADLDFIALETINYQMDLLDGISIPLQFEDYKANELFKEYDAMLACYIDQDLDCMLAMMEEYDQLDFIDELIYQRNLNWIVKLQNEILPNTSVFMAVGAGHLPGDKGVIQLLRKAGYTVEPYK